MPTVQTLSSHPGILGGVLGFVAGFMMIVTASSAAAGAVGLVVVGILLGIFTRRWLLEVVSLVLSLIVGSLCALATVIWPRDPTAHNLWPLELLMIDALAGAFLLVLAGIGRLLRRFIIHS